MPRSCASCNLPEPVRKELDRRLRSGATLDDVRRWLTEAGHPVGRNAVGRHRGAHVLPGRALASGPRPKGQSFLSDVVEVTHDRVVLGELVPSVRDAVAASSEIARQRDRSADRDIALKVAAALGGLVKEPSQAYVAYRAEHAAEYAAVEGEFAEVLSGDDHRPAIPATIPTHEERDEAERERDRSRRR